MILQLLAISFLAAAPEVVIDGSGKTPTESTSQVELEEMLDALDEEEIVFDDLELSSEEDFDCD